jgi:broad specificity phosphatase PhoE
MEQFTEQTKKKYDLQITVIRHGPKQGFGGPLTPSGRFSTQKYFIELATRADREEPAQRKLISSPVQRARETAEIYENIVKKYSGIDSSKLEIDERLSEQNVEDFKNQLPPEQQDEWFSFWYTAKRRPRPDIYIGEESIPKFASWLMEKVGEQRITRKRLSIDSFSHGPVMAAFILRLEEKLKTNILPSSLKDRGRLEFDRLFGEPRSPFRYLSKIQFLASSATPFYVDLRIENKTLKIPWALLERLSRKL